MRKYLVVALVVCFAPFYAEAAKPILNIVDQPVPIQPDGRQLSAEDVQFAIIEGCRARGWAPTIESDDTIRASITVRGRHYAEVEIPFSETSYSIIYVESDNLDYNETKQRIHRNYNKWVLNLSASINTKFGTSIDARTESQLALLGELRDRGILTEEEFQAEKKRILADR